MLLYLICIGPFDEGGEREREGESVCLCVRAWLDVCKSAAGKPAAGR